MKVEKLLLLKAEINKCHVSLEQHENRYTQQ